MYNARGEEGLFFFQMKAKLYTDKLLGETRTRALASLSRLLLPFYFFSSTLALSTVLSVRIDPSIVTFSCPARSLADSLGECAGVNTPLTCACWKINTQEETPALHQGSREG